MDGMLRPSLNHGTLHQWKVCRINCKYENTRTHNFLSVQYGYHDISHSAKPFTHLYMLLLHNVNFLRLLVTWSKTWEAHGKQRLSVSILGFENCQSFFSPLPLYDVHSLRETLRVRAETANVALMLMKYTHAYTI